MRKTFIILFSVVAIALLLVVVLPLFLLKKSFDDVGERLGGGGKAYVNEQLSSAYVLEDGVVAYRPSSTGQIIAANIFSLGTAGRPEWLVGKTLDRADAGSFEVLAQRYGRDRSAVYFEWSAIDEADVDTFAPVGFGFAQDARSVWVGQTQVMAGLELAAGDVKAHGQRVFSVRDQAYYLKDTPIALSEMPRTEIVGHCRDWYEMNGALWFVDMRLDLPTGPIDVVDCDGSRRSGPDGEVVEDNKGLLFTAGNTAYLARITGAVGVAHQFDADVVDALFFEPHHKENLMIARLADDRVVVVDLSGERAVQLLGVFPELADKAFRTGGHSGLWLQDRFFVYNEDKTKPIYTDYGKAARQGRYVIADKAVFSGPFEIIGADPASFEVLRGDVARDRQACFVYGRYVGDLPERSALEGEAAYEVCWGRYDQAFLEYDGMRISFVRDFTRVLNGGAADEGDEFVHDYVLGTVRIENLTDAVLVIDPDFYTNVDGWVSSGRAVKIDVERPELMHAGQHALGPKEVVSWPLKVRSDVPNLGVGFHMSVTHFGAKRARFGEQPMRFSSTYLSGASVGSAD